MNRTNHIQKVSFSSTDSVMSNFFRYIYLFINTVKFLKFQQILYRIIRKLVKRRPEKVLWSLRKASFKWSKIYLYPEKIDTNGNSFFLNFNQIINIPEVWKDSSYDKLWLYNLHYFDDLLSFNAEKKSHYHINLLESWIENNHYSYSIGWDPYPTSLRVVNLIKANLNGLEVSTNILDSMSEQLNYLYKNKEIHLMGNHYFSNLKALLFGGLFFEGKEPNLWLDTSLKKLKTEIEEQVLPDGANFELSPMYQALMLTDMLDIYNISNNYHKQIPNSFLILLDKKISKMISFYLSMLHPDSGLSFFNDSVDGIAPSKEIILKYAKKLGFSVPFKELEKDLIDIYDHSDSGYLVACNKDFKLIFDAGNIGPSYIPGHAHADTLSFELSVGNERVFVNSGISHYNPGEDRLLQRGTAAHNTVEVDNKNSSEVWHNFRVANRAKITKRKVQIKEKEISFEAEHNGYKSFYSGCIHNRIINFKQNEITIIDEINGSYKKAISRLYLHPNIKIRKFKNTIELRGLNFKMILKFHGSDYKVINSLWHKEFGKVIDNKCLEFDLKMDLSSVTATWEIFD